MKRALIISLGIVGFATVVTAQKRDNHFPKPNCTTIVAEAMFQEVDTTKPRGVSDNYHTWENGKAILVKFTPGGSKALRDKVVQCAKEWEKYANVTFKFLPDTASNTNIRIRLGKGYGHNSAVGTEANFRQQSNPTMNFDTLYFADADYYIASLQKRGIKPPYNLN